MAVLTWSEIQLPEDFYELIYDCEWIDESEWKLIALSASEWIREAWEILSEAGLATYRTEAEYCKVLITFLALIGLYTEFGGLEAEDYCLEWAEKLEIKAYQVRRLFGNIFGQHLNENEYGDDELDRSQLWCLVKDAHRQVVALLTESAGSELELSGSIWQSVQLKIDNYEEYEECDEEYNFFRAETEIINNLKLEEDINAWIEKYELENIANEKATCYETEIDEVINLTAFTQPPNQRLNQDHNITVAIQQLIQVFKGEIISLEEDYNQGCFQYYARIPRKLKLNHIQSKCTNKVGFFKAATMSYDVNPKCPFTIRTFELFEELCSGTYDFSLAYTEFKEFVEAPFQQLCHQVATQLPDPITERLETKEGVFNGIIPCDSDEYDSDSDEYDSDSNEYDAQGQFYLDYSFYFKGRNWDSDAQLFVQLNEEFLKFGFYIGENSVDSRIRFDRNCQKHQYDLVCILWDSLCDDKLIYGGLSENGESEFTWKDWLKNSSYPVIYAAVHLTADEVLQSSVEKLSRQIAQTFERFFPLVLLATSDNPMPVIREYLNHPKPQYPLEQCADNIGIEKTQLERWLRAIERKRQAIFYGSPGTGKTFIVEQLARHLTGDKDDQWELVQFHPAYSYEDFIQGIRPQSQDGALTYPLVPGRFLEFCEKAKSCQGLCVLIIDEINRANLAQVFGELMYLLEYRDKKIRLAGSSELFGIPENVRIIGTMNTADRSIALVDHALRRRFAFVEIRPNYDVLRRYHEKKETGFQVDGLIETLKRLNKVIADKNYEIGISFFLTENLAEELEDIWQMEIEPYLEEYFYDQLDKVDEFRWDKIEQQVRL